MGADAGAICPIRRQVFSSGSKALVVLGRICNGNGSDQQQNPTTTDLAFYEGLRPEREHGRQEPNQSPFPVQIFEDSDIYLTFYY